MHESFQARCRSKAWPLVIGAEDGEVLLTCLVNEGSTFFASGSITSTSLVNTETRQEEPLLKLMIKQ